MKKAPFKKLISSVEKLPKVQYRGLKDHIKGFDKRKEVANLIESKASVKCGHCGSENFNKHGVRDDFQRYKCKSCGKTFNILTGTPIARLRKKGRWLNYTKCMAEGLTLQKSADLVGVNITTSFRWRHTFLENSNNLNPSNLNGIVEGIETYFYYSEKGKKNPSSISKERIGKKAPKVYVITSRDRHRYTFNEIIGSFQPNNISEIQSKALDNNIIFCSAEKKFYKSITQNLSLKHIIINHKTKDNITHTKNVTKYKENLHNWMKRFYGVATKYLSNYLSWFQELDEYKMNLPPEVLLLRGRSLEEYPYQPLTQK
jgi:transposase-like protein